MPAYPPPILPHHPHTTTTPAQAVLVLQLICIFFNLFLGVLGLCSLLRRQSSVFAVKIK